jgi:hypothetical protein
MSDAARRGDDKTAERSAARRQARNAPFVIDMGTAGPWHCALAEHSLKPEIWSVSTGRFHVPLTLAFSHAGKDFV